MNAIVISVGSELLTGETVDTNAAFISGGLCEIGIETICHICVNDDEEAIAPAVSKAAAVADIVIVTGGIGPTPDDRTRQAVARAAGVPLEPREQVLDKLQSFFASRDREMSPANAVQANFPRGASVLENRKGTASGFLVHIGSAAIIVLPGVPSEMKDMWEKSVAPSLVGKSGRVIAAGSINCFGMSEAKLGERLADLMEKGKNPSVGDTAEEGIIRVRIRAAAETKPAALALLDKTKAEVTARLPEAAFGEDNDTLESVVVNALGRKNLTVTTAESCTGGLIAKRITDVPGSSRVFAAGIVAYHNEAKECLLAVAPELIEKHGAVSKEVAVAMAEGALERSGADFALSTTGIAGPAGATEIKPVGLVFAALASKDKTVCRKLHLTGSRSQVRDRTAKHLLNMLRLEIR